MDEKFKKLPILPKPSTANRVKKNHVLSSVSLTELDVIDGECEVTGECAWVVGFEVVVDEPHSIMSFSFFTNERKISKVP